MTSSAKASSAYNPLLLFFLFCLSDQVVCQDGGADEADDEEQQVKHLLTAYEYFSPYLHVIHK